MNDQQSSNAASSAAPELLADIQNRHDWFFQELRRLKTEAGNIATEMDSVSDAMGSQCDAIDAYIQTESYLDTSNTGHPKPHLVPFSERLGRLDARDKELNSSLRKSAEYLVSTGIVESLAAHIGTAPAEVEETFRTWEPVKEGLQAAISQLSQASERLVQTQQESLRRLERHLAALRQRMPGGDAEGAPAL